jgi:hypothetical protein
MSSMLVRMLPLAALTEVAKKVHGTSAAKLKTG